MSDKIFECAEPKRLKLKLHPKQIVKCSGVFEKIYHAKCVNLSEYDVSMLDTKIGLL